MCNRALKLRERVREGGVRRMTDSIGETAGKVWKFLKDNGPATSSRLGRELKCTRDEAHRAIGWLAREDKLNFERLNGSEKISLK
jgi:predicted HTH transcriptional regulator